MANLLVHVELEGRTPTRACRAALAQARAVADALGATVYALIYVNDVDDEFLDGVASEVGRAGADRVWGVAGSTFDAPALDATCGPALLGVFDRLRPRVVWLTGDTGWQLGPPLAVRTGALFLPRGVVTMEAEQVWFASRSSQTGEATMVALAEAERPLIVLGSATAPSQPLGAPLGELELLGTSTAAPADATWARARVLDVVPDPAELRDRPRLILVAGGDRSALADLRAGLPEGVAVADLEQTPSTALAAAAPEAVLCLALSAPAHGWGRVALALGPNTRLAFAGRRGADHELPRTDVAWRPASADLVPSLVEALARRST